MAGWGELDTTLLDRIERQKELRHQASLERRPRIEMGDDELTDADKASWQRYLNAQREAAVAEMELLARAIGLIPSTEGAIQ